MVEVQMAHVSMQFSDSKAKIKDDVDKIFSRGYKILTGTEAGPGGDVRPILLKGAIDAGYRIHFAAADSWVAVSKNFIESAYETGYRKVIDASEGVGKHGDRGIVWVKFKSTINRTFVVGAGHYLTNGRRPGDPNYLLNKRHGPAFREWVSTFDKKTIILYNGDQNIVDRNLDTFFGAPFTSSWDTLKKWPNTGHGNIDVMASFDGNIGFKWKSTRALSDDRLSLNTDHFLVQAVAEVEPHRKEKRMTPQRMVARNLRKRGRKVYGRRRCLIFSSVYRNRLKTHPHHIIRNGDNDTRNDRVDTLWAHISVTKAVDISMASCMRTLHKIGMDRFGSGISYNFAIHHRTGEIGLGQHLDAKGTHTIVHRTDLPNYSMDQNAVALAIVFIGMPGMKVTKEAWESYEHLIAALIEEGFLTTHFDHNPHSFAVSGTPFAKDCPTETVRQQLPELKQAGLAKVRRG